MAKGNDNIFDYELGLGVIAIIAGIVVIAASSTILNIIAIIIGIWIVYSGLVRLGLGFQLKKIKSDLWVAVTVIASIMTVCGLYMIVNNGAIYQATQAIGVVIIVYSVLDLVESIIYMKNLKQLSK